MEVPFLTVYGGGSAGGAPQYFFVLFEHLNRERYKPIWVSLGRDNLAKRFSAMGIETELAKGVADIKALARKHNAAFLHTHGVRANFTGRMAGRGLKLPVLTTVHSLIGYDYTDPLRRLLASTVDGMTLSMSQRFIAISEAVAEDLKRRGVSQDRISIVHNGVGEAGPSSREWARSEMKIPMDAQVIVSVSRLFPVKGLDILLEALALLPEPRPHWVVIGEGPEREALLQGAAKIGFQDLHLMGHRADARDLLPGADLFVQPSRMEGLSLSILEAMAAGIPVIASRVGGIPEIIDDPVNGLLVPPQDPAALAAGITRLLSSPEMGVAMVQEGFRTFREGFSAESFTLATESIFDAMARGGLSK